MPRPFQVVRQSVFRANLKHTQPRFMRERQHGAKSRSWVNTTYWVSDCLTHDVFVAAPRVIGVSILVGPILGGT